MDRASWPISWAAFQVAVVANYQNIVDTIDGAIVNNEGQAQPWYLSHVPEAIVMLAILVTVLGLLATALNARQKEQPPAPGPDVSPGAGTGCPPAASAASPEEPGDDQHDRQRET